MRTHVTISPLRWVAWIGPLLLLLAACQPASQDNASGETQAETAAVAAAVAPEAAPCELNVGWDPWEPYSFETVGGELAGMDIELVRAIADEARCTLRFKQGKWRDLLAALRVGQVDVLMAATALDDRREYAYFSEPYRSELFVQLVRSSDAEAYAGKTVGELAKAGKTIGLTDGYFYGDQVHELLGDETMRDAFLMAAVPELNYRRLVDGEVDVVVGDPYVATAILRRTGNNSAVTRLDGDVISGPVSLMYSRDSVDAKTVERMDAAMARIAPKLEAIRARYLGGDG
ncbi:amino acid ABC transporter substrate-binding protein [bacterium]|nr:amino acid ABC transporter substrate-binding protein [bacterium]